MGRKSRRSCKSQRQRSSSPVSSDREADRGGAPSPEHTVVAQETETLFIARPCTFVHNTLSSAQSLTCLVSTASGDESSHPETGEQRILCPVPDTVLPSKLTDESTYLPGPSVPFSSSQPNPKVGPCISDQHSSPDTIPVIESSSSTILNNPPAARDEVSLLQNQLSAMSVRLLAAQDQIDRLLEEKRSWLDHIPPNKLANQQPTSGELRGRLAQAQALAETYKREKENMVVKYAQSEQKRIDLQNQLAAITKQTQLSKPILPGPGNSTNGTDSALDLEGTSTEAQEMQSRLNQTTKALNTAREEIEGLRKSHKNDEARINILEARLSQMQETIRAEQRKTTTQNETISRLNRLLEAANKQAKEADRLREREAERLCLEVAHQEAQEQLKRLKSECTTLKEKVSELEQVKTELAEKEEHLSKLIAENTHMAELQSELETIKQREQQLSEFTRRLTERNTNLQAEHLLTLSRLEESERLLQEYKSNVSQSEAAAVDKVSEHQMQIEQLKRTVTDLQDQLKKSRDHEGELCSELAAEREQADLTHKRDLGRIRDLKRQLARAAQHRSMSLVNGLNQTAGEDANPLDSEVIDSDSVCKFSVGSPTTSVHSVELNVQSNPTAPTKPPVYLGNTLLVTGEGKPSPSDRVPTEDSGTHSDELDRAAWIAKIDRLQRTQLRLTDKMEFLQEHCYQLTEELHKKSRIIQSFVMAEKHLGSASPNAVDANRARIAQTGGLMASLYGAKHSKDTFDRETYLEISQKLQAVLEDTLFKNITLKENLNTLGSEISSLNSLVKEIREKLCENCRQATSNIQKLPPASSTSTVSNPKPVYRYNTEPPTFYGGGVSA